MNSSAPNHIPAGFSLAITSWENDADFYKTQTFHGLSRDDAEFLLAIASMFKSMNSSGGLGGASWHWKNGQEDWIITVANAIDTVVSKFADKDVSHELYESWIVDRSIELDVDNEDFDPSALFDEYNERLFDLLGYPETDMYREEPYIRVFDDFTVHRYFTDVHDVSKEFSV